MKTLKTSFTLACLATIMLLAGSCDRSTRQGGDNLTIHFRQAESIDMDRYLNKIRFVQLENQPQSAFASIDKMVFCGKDIFMLDRRLKAVFCFDTSGHFRYRIQRVGRGPHEYTELSSMWVRPPQRELWLHTFWPGSNLVFDLDGNLLRESKVDWPAMDMTGIGSQGMVAFNNTQSQNGNDKLPAGAYLLNDSGKLRKHLVRFGDTTMYWSMRFRRNLEEFEAGALLLGQPDTIFRITPDGKTYLDAVLDWGKLTFPNDLRSINFGSPRSSEVVNFEGLKAKDQLIAFGSFRFFRIFFGGHMELAVADVRLREGCFSTVLSGSGTRMPLIFPIAKTDRGQLVGIYDMDILLAMKDSRENRPPSPTGYDLYSEMDSMVDHALECDRPVLWIADIKPELLTSTNTKQ